MRDFWGCTRIVEGWWEEPCLSSLIVTFNDILFEGKLPEEWMLSSLVPIFKGREIPRSSSNSYLGNKIVRVCFHVV